MFSSNQIRAVLAIAIPMIVSNITTPLLGIVDTSVLGHLPSPHLLAGVTIGSMLITAIVWLFGFLRMSVTGLTAQAIVKPDGKQNASIILRQGLITATLVCFVVLLLQPYILQIGLWYSNVEPLTLNSTKDYFQIRIWSMPASLFNLVLLGWLLAQNQARQIMWVQILINLTNVFLDLILVYQFNFGVKGVAWASLTAEYLGLFCLIYLSLPLIATDKFKRLHEAFNWTQLKPFLNVNRDILLRTLMLEISLLFLTFQGARLGVEIVAVNAVLMNFMMLISLGLDGIAYAAEVLVGQHYGANRSKELKNVIKTTAIFSFCLALFYSFIFCILGQSIIYLMTDIESIRLLANDYLIYIILLPLTAFTCFLCDGIFIGLAASKAMRNSMAIAVFAVYFPVWLAIETWGEVTQTPVGNHALWLALHAMMLARGVTLALKIPFYIARAEPVNAVND